MIACRQHPDSNAVLLRCSAPHVTDSMLNPLLWLQSPKGKWPPIKAGDDTGTALLGPAIACEHACPHDISTSLIPRPHAVMIQLSYAASKRSQARHAAQVRSMPVIPARVCAANMAAKHFAKLKARWTLEPDPADLNQPKINGPAQVSVTA